MFYNIIYTITDSIFHGTFVFVPCLFIIHLFKIRIFNIDQTTLAKAINGILLFGSTVFILATISEIFVEYYSGGKYEQYTFTNRFIGPYWFALGLPFFNYALLPQIMWVKEFRNRIIVTIVMVTIWGLLHLFLLKVFAIRTSWYIAQEFETIAYLKQVIIYIIMILTTYCVFAKSGNS